MAPAHDLCRMLEAGDIESNPGPTQWHHCSVTLRSGLPHFSCATTTCTARCHKKTECSGVSRYSTTQESLCPSSAGFGPSSETDNAASCLMVASAEPVGWSTESRKVQYYRLCCSSFTSTLLHCSRAESLCLSSAGFGPSSETDNSASCLMVASAEPVGWSTESRKVQYYRLCCSSLTSTP